MRLNRWWVLAAMVVYSGIAAAEPEGLILSVAAGVANHTGKINYGSDDAGVADTGIVAQSGRVGFGGTLAAGYNLNITQAFRLVTELFGQLYGGDSHPFDVTTTDVSNQITRYKVTERLRYSVGVAIKPFFEIDQSTAFFLSLGYQQGQFRNKISGQNVGSSMVTESDDHQRGGWRYGLGFQFHLSPNLSTTLSVEHTRFKHKIVWPVGSANGLDMSAHSNVTQAQLGLSYYMGA